MHWKLLQKSRAPARHFGGEQLECRRLFAAVSWIGPATGDWSDPANWNDGGQVPGVNDDVTINVSSSVEVNVGVADETVHSLVTSNAIVISNGNTLAVQAGLTLQSAAAILVDGAVAGTSLFLQGTQSVSGSGSIQLGASGAGGSLQVSGTVTVDSGITLSGAGTGGISLTSAADTLINNGELIITAPDFPISGISGGGNFQNSGTIDIGEASSILVSQLSSFTLEPTSDLSVFVGGSSGAALVTNSNGAPPVVLDGTLAVTPDSAFVPLAGTVLQVTSFQPSSTGAFSSITGLDQSTYSFTPTNAPTGLTLTVNSSVTPGPTSLVFAQEPVAGLVNSVLSPVVVDVEDSNGNIVTTDGSNVTLSFAEGTSATLAGTTTVPAVNGVATFADLTVAATGTYTLVATDRTDISAVSTNFRITASPQHIGALNSDFAVEGLAGHSIGFSSTDGIAEDENRSILIGTVGTSPNESFGVTRYNADGSIDTSFGTGGVVTTSFNGTDDVPSTVLVLPGGQILVGGTATTFAGGVSTGSQFALAELNADGSPDTSFGAGTGQVLLSVSGTLGDDMLKALATTPAGVIYAGGSSNNDFAIAAINPDGTLANGFGSGGHVLLDFAGGDDVINSLAVQKNGSIVAAGSTTSGAVTSVALARFLPSGVLDKHFGNKGTVVTSVRGVFDSASSVAIQPKGQIVIGGLSATGAAGSLNTDFLLARYTSAGKLDRTFAGGTVITSFGQPAAVTQLLIQANGEIIASGKTTATLTNVVTNQLDVAIARYTISGKLDTSFNNTGTAIISLNDDGPSGASVHVLPADLIVTSTLGDQFDQFDQSNEGTIVMTPGGELLDAGTSGTDTVEAEIITAGVDLVTTLLTAPPASVVGGIKGMATVKIAESGTSLATGTVTIDVQVATDALGDGATTITSLPERLDLRQQQSHTYHVAFAFPAGLTAGHYYLVAAVDDGSTPALQDLNQNNNIAASSSTVDISPPFISLAGSGLTTSGAVDAGKSAKVNLTLDNQGNVLAKGSISVQLLFSTDQTTTNAISVAVKPVAVALPADKSKPIKFTALVPSTVVSGTYYLIAVIDSADILGSIDRTSSTVVDPVLISVG